MHRPGLFNRIIIKTEDQIAGIRKSSQLAGHTLDYIEDYVKEGVTTEFLNKKIEEFIRANKAIPATLNYKGYPKSCCISLNEVVCHGIPGERYILQKGDILNIDVTTILNGYYGDTSRMFYVGNVSESASELIATTRKCLQIGINQCYPENYFGNIGYFIHDYAKSKGFSVVSDYCGHGVGLRFHEEPQVEHAAERNSGKRMKPGMIFTIEPMINQGTSRTILDKKDGWTARTADGKLSAQFEHTILVTLAGCEVLTDTKAEFQPAKAYAQG
jgi:methionyl aminopeptidase